MTIEQVKKLCGLTNEPGWCRLLRPAEWNQCNKGNIGRLDGSSGCFGKIRFIVHEGTGIGAYMDCISWICMELY